MRARKDEGEGVLREGILGSSAQFVRAVGEKLFSEKLFSEKLFSKLGCLREVVLEKLFCAKPFYASRPGGCSWRSRSATRCSASPYVLRERILGSSAPREGILGSPAQFVRAVGEKLFSEKLFSKLACLTEVVLEKPFCAKSFYASQPGSCS